MQVLKDKIRNAIVVAAKEEFLMNGYGKASMRDIAKKSGITPGNIYRYFENKEGLFEAVVSDTYLQLMDIANVDFSVSKVTDRQLYEERRTIIVDRLANLTLERRDELVILLDKSNDTHYENLVEEFYLKLEEQVVSKIADFVESEGKKIDRDIFMKLISKGFVNSLKEIITHYSAGETDKIRTYLFIAFDIFFYDLTERFS